jgi:alpha-L-fucosidase
VDKYQPQLVWFDWWIQHGAFKPYLQRFAAYYYNKGAAWGKGVAINYKFEAFPEGTAVFDIERGQVSGLREGFWQNDTSVSKNAWGYIENHDYKEVISIIHDLVDVVSKNGALLLNIGPKADGTIPEPEREMLRGIGAWLKQNGEAIYGTGPWETFGEGPTVVPEGYFSDTGREAFTAQDIRFTAKKDTVYATVMAWPETPLTITSLKEGSSLNADAIAEIRFLGHGEPLSWTQDAQGLHIELPAAPVGEHAFVIKIVLKTALKEA